MSNYSTELRYIIESEYSLGMDNYPIFDESYREKLNLKILEHYYFHEIGFETVERFKYYLNTTLNEIMPYYNKLYESELLSINPLLTFTRNSTDTKAKTNTERQLLSTSKEDTLTKEITDHATNIINNTLTKNMIDADTINTTKTLSGTGDIVNEKHDTKTINSTDTDNLSESVIKNVAGSDNSKSLHSDTPSALVTDSNLADNYYISDATINTDTKSLADDTVKESLNTKTTTNTDNTTSTNTETRNTVDTEANTGTVTTTHTGTDSTAETQNLQNTVNESNVNNGSITGDNTITNNESESVTHTDTGFEMPLSELIIKYRETFLNIDMMVINDLKELFMMIY